ncbi:MAG: NAD-dependent protein deacetylase [Acidilobus sp.]
MEDAKALAKRVAEALVSSEFAVMLTGAGVSTASGIPDFRGPQGLWRRVDPSLFEISYFYSNPLDSWRLFADRFGTLREVRPNPAHLGIARLEEIGLVKAVITQNIDGLHQAAGSRRVIELHGNARYAVCTECGRRYPVEEALSAVREGRLPTCPACGGLLKPDVVYFGEPLSPEALQEAYMMAENSDLFLVVGSSLAVSPANQLPVVAKARGARLMIVNMGETALDDIADLKVEAPVERFVPMVCAMAEDMVSAGSDCRAMAGLQ